MRKFEKWLPSMIIVVVLLISMAGGAVYAKYVTEKTLNGTVAITANLGTIEILERQAQRQPDGSYTLLDATVTQNEYILIPGLDIPKDPIVRITNKSPIEAYVYIKVDTNISSSGTGIKYTLDSCWKPVDGHANVYVYCGNAEEPVPVSTNIDIPILFGNIITVSQYLNQNVAGSCYLNFTATMRQTVEGKTAEEIYEDNTNY